MVEVCPGWLSDLILKYNFIAVYNYIYENLLFVFRYLLQKEASNPKALRIDKNYWRLGTKNYYENKNIFKNNIHDYNKSKEGKYWLVLVQKQEISRKQAASPTFYLKQDF